MTTTLATEATEDRLQRILDDLPRPLLILSTVVGRGMHSIGAALLERCGGAEAEHRAIEEFLPPAGVREDMERYRLYASYAPVLLNVAYRLPLVYQYKLLRERYLRPTGLAMLQDLLAKGRYRSVLCVSHRPAFWTAFARARMSRSTGGPPLLYGLCGEYGSTFGWRFVPWEAIDGFLSPVPRAELRFGIPGRVRFEQVELPVRREFTLLRDRPANRKSVLLVCGHWGQGRMDRVLARLLSVDPTLEVAVVCGENEKQRRAVEAAIPPGSSVEVHGVVESLGPLMARAAAVVTKPGIATLLEARAARRQIFLLRGMPVAEDNNMRFAIAHHGAARFTPRAFRAWLDDPDARVP